MRKIIKFFVKLCAGTLPLEEPIYEFGSFQDPDDLGIANLRLLFKNKEFIGADMRQGLGVDIILNLHKIDLPSESVGTVLLLDTIEHVEFPRKAINELYRILKPNGIVIMSSVMNFLIHNHPYDYWRFTPEGFRSLLKDFSYKFVDYAGDEKFPHTVIAIGFKGDIPPEFNEKFMNIYKKEWKNFQLTEKLKKKKKNYILKQIIPPMLLKYYRKVKSK